MSTNYNLPQQHKPQPKNIWKIRWVKDRIIISVKTLILKKLKNEQDSLRKDCLYSELVWSVFFRIRFEYGEILRISPYSARMRENAGRNNSEYKHFSRSD